jgi:hypothetical protein
MSVNLPFETENDADAYRVLQVVDRRQTFARDFRFGSRAAPPGFDRRA